MELAKDDIVSFVRTDLDSRNQVIKSLYSDRKLKGRIYDFVLKNGGDQEKANDVFVITIMNFIKQCYKPYFELKNEVYSYLYTIARNEWIKLHKKGKRETSTAEINDPSVQDSIETEIINSEVRDKLKSVLQLLDEKCRKVMLQWANNIDMRSIAINLQYKSAGMARKKKHQCLQKLRELIKKI